MTARPLARLLIGWFRQHARPLPWRMTLDPYAIWVSEIMLQQTQVKTVIPYYERWMNAFPNVSALAEADSESVLRLWEGLGYYSRARNLQAAARAIVAHHKSVFPRNFAEVLDLPGVGRYTAGALCSIAYNDAVPILDGNVIRVLSRLTDFRGNVKLSQNRDLLWNQAESLVLAASLLGKGQGARATPNSGVTTAGTCSELNQSLMELGALICTPRNPDCANCPVGQRCAAREKGMQQKLPNLGKRPASWPRRMLALVLEHKGRYLMRRRKTAAAIPFWEFPSVDLPDGAGEESARKECARLGIKPDELRLLCVIRHSITRHRITLEVFHSSVQPTRRFDKRAARWVGRKGLEALPLMAAHRRITRRLGLVAPPKSGTIRSSSQAVKTTDYPAKRP